MQFEYAEWGRRLWEGGEKVCLDNFGDNDRSSSLKQLQLYGMCHSMWICSDLNRFNSHLCNDALQQQRVSKLHGRIFGLRSCRHYKFCEPWFINHTAFFSREWMTLHWCMLHRLTVPYTAHVSWQPAEYLAICAMLSASIFRLWSLVHSLT